MIPYTKFYASKSNNCVTLFVYVALLACVPCTVEAA